MQQLPLEQKVRNVIGNLQLWYCYEHFNELHQDIKDMLVMWLVLPAHLQIKSALYKVFPMMRGIEQRAKLTKGCSMEWQMAILDGKVKV